MKKYSGFKPRSLVGVVLIAFAVLLFLDNIGIRFLHIIFHNWPLALIIIGAALLGMHKSAPGNENAIDTGRILPYFLIGAGVLFFAVRLFGFNISALIVPLALLYAGFLFLRPRRQAVDADAPLQLEASADAQNADDPPQPSGTAADDENRIDIFAVLSGGDYSTRSHNLTGGNITAIFGGVDVDIRDADTQKDVIEIEVLALFGGVELRVPPHWQVTSRVLPVLGGVSNKTTCLAERMRVGKKQLIVTGTALFGGVDVRN